MLKNIKRKQTRNIFLKFILPLLIIGCSDNRYTVEGDWMLFSKTYYYECHVDSTNFTFFLSFFKDRISESESDFSVESYTIRNDTLFFDVKSKFRGSPFKILDVDKNTIHLRTLGDGLNDTIIMKRVEKDFFKISDIKTSIDSTKYMFHFYNRKNAFYGDSFKVNVDSITDVWIKSSFEIDTIEMIHVDLDSIIPDSSDLQSEREK